LINQDTPSYFTGFDGGGTRTRGLVIDATNNVLCQVQGASSNVYKLEVEKAVANIAALVNEIEALIPGYRLAASSACIGLAGIVEGQVSPALTNALAGLGIGGEIYIHNDAYLSCYGIAEGESAIALISGTGSVAFAFDCRGNVITGGGLGYLYGDEGSGFEIGSAGIRSAVAFAEKRGPATALLDSLLTEQCIEDISCLPAVLNSPELVSGFAKTVHFLACQGDAEALRLIDQAAHGLTELVEAVLARIDPGPDEKPPVGLFGGCLVNMELLKSRVVARIQAMGLQVCEVSKSPQQLAAELARARYLE
jgi:N-acetylglucosamine kinase-like BadF-type ATPase